MFLKRNIPAIIAIGAFFTIFATASPVSVFDGTPGQADRPNDIPKGVFAGINRTQH